MPQRMPWKEYGRYGSVGIELVASIAIGYYGGRWLDRHFHANGWLTGIGFLVGVYAGFRVLFQTARKMQRDIEIAEEKQNQRADQRADQRTDQRTDDDHPDLRSKDRDEH